MVPEDDAEAVVREIKGKIPNLILDQVSGGGSVAHRPSSGASDKLVFPCSGTGGVPVASREFARMVRWMFLPQGRIPRLQN